MSESRNEKGQLPKRTPLQVLERAQKALESIKGAVASTAEYKVLFEAHRELWGMLSGGKPVVAGKQKEQQAPETPAPTPQKPPEANA